VVERTFGLLKLHYGLGKARCLGLKRNKTRVQFVVMSHNQKTEMNVFTQMQNLKEMSRKEPKIERQSKKTFGENKFFLDFMKNTGDFEKICVMQRSLLGFI
jgi:IS5 family transposase